MFTNLVPSIRLQVLSFVRGALDGHWDEVAAQEGRTVEEIRAAAQLFNNDQERYNDWRRAKSEELRASGQLDKASEMARAACHICEAPLFSSTGHGKCPCYANFRPGYIQFVNPEPKVLEQEWLRLGGAWLETGELGGTQEARNYVSRACYSDSCRSCKKAFLVAIREVIKVGHILEISLAGGTGFYEIRGYCPGCKPERRQMFKKSREKAVEVQM